LGERRGEGWNEAIQLNFFCLFFTLVLLLLFLIQPSFLPAKDFHTKITRPCDIKDAKVIGSGVGVPWCGLRSLETGEILAQGKQGGGTGVKPTVYGSTHKKRGEILYGTPGCSPFFQAEIPFRKTNKQVEIYTEAPLPIPMLFRKVQRP